MQSIRSARGYFVLAAVLIVLGACDDSVPQAPRGMGRSSGGGPKAEAAQPAKVEGLSFKDDDFVESDRHRDPFRSFTVQPRVRGPEVVMETQRLVIMSDTPVEQMRLIAVISGLSRPKAMLLDPHNVGFVVQRGDYIGRAQVLQTTGSVAMALNWRVDRIRDDQVVLTRQDPSDPGRPPLSRIISMHDEIAAR